MTLKEITVAEWNEIDYQKNTYFCNGCVFDEKTDNLIAFSWYEDELHEAGKHYKVVSNNLQKAIIKDLLDNSEAKEIIKELLRFVDSLGNYSGGIFDKAEQFITELEK